MSPVLPPNRARGGVRDAQVTLQWIDKCGSVGSTRREGRGLKREDTGLG